MVNEMLATTASIQPKDSGVSGGQTRESVVYRLADDMLSKLPADYVQHEVQWGISYDRPILQHPIQFLYTSSWLVAQVQQHQFVRQLNLLTNWPFCLLLSCVSNHVMYEWWNVTSALYDVVVKYKVEVPCIRLPVCLYWHFCQPWAVWHEAWKWLPAGERQVKEDGTSTAAQHISASGDWSDAESSYGCEKHTQWSQAGHRRHHHHVGKPSRCSRLHVWRKDTSYLETGENTIIS